MQIIVLLIVFIHTIDDLLIPLAAQGGYNQGLGLPAGEQHRTMGPGQKCGFNGDIADIGGTAAITADARFQYPFAESGLEFVIYQSFDFFFRFREFLCHCGCCIIMQFLGSRFPFLFITNLNNTLNLSTQGLIHCHRQVFVGLFFRYFPFFGFYFSHDLFLQRDDLLNILVGEFQCVHEYIFRNHIRFALHHNNSLAIS